MALPSIPKTMRAWQYSSTSSGGISANLKLATSVPLPVPKANQHLVQILYVALNPVDYKPSELPLIGRFLIPKPATPCVDFAGRIITPARECPKSQRDLKAGDLVFGVSGSNPIAGGALREFNVADADAVTRIPEGVEVRDAAGIAVAGLTAYQSIVPRVKKGDRIFINGGSGGVGCFGVQIAKIMGCEVVTSCSTRNVEFVKGLGADVVLDYTQGSVLKMLRERVEKVGRFDHIVDNVGMDEELIWKSHELLKPEKVYVRVSGDLSINGLKNGVKKAIWPKAIGGLKGNVEGFWPKPVIEHLDQLAAWMSEREMKPVVDSVLAFEDAPKAFEKLKTGRARGKIIVDVTGESTKG